MSLRINGMVKPWLSAFGVVAGLGAVGPAGAGPVFLTGHDPDFHAQSSAGAVVLLKEALNFATNGTYAGGTEKFLYVQADISPPSGHLDGVTTLEDIGLVEGTNFDVVDATGLAALPNFNSYSAIVVASDFGGLLSQAELDELIARKADIANFINGGGGLAAFAECGVGFPDCIPDLVTPGADLFGFLPVTVSSIATTAPYTVTPYGESLGLTDADINDPTHNSFGAIGGLNIVDNDANGIPTTLAGIVNVGPNGFIPEPEPASLAILGAGIGWLGLGRLRRRK